MSGRSAIAIVGMACRYPDASNPAELWQTVLGRRVAFRPIPRQRLSSAYVGGGGDPDDVDRTYVTHAGLLRGWQFDRRRFGVPGSLYRAADQTHWLALQTAADALADAGFPEGDGLNRDRVGVVLGNSLTGEFSRAAMLRLRWPFIAAATGTALANAGLSDELTSRVLADVEAAVKLPFPRPGDETLAGALANTIAGRVCNHFDFHGTGYTVDGACASSLLAVMTAARYLLTGELSFALAGGVDLSLDPFELVGFARIGALATDEMRVYDVEPTGFLPGEGCGVVALMRAEEAARLGLRSYATLVGWGMSSDGSGGLTRPEVSGQARALRRAYSMAELDPADLGLVEGHGTGTAVGDEVELEALTGLLQPAGTHAALGTVKANIGHTKAAAGVAGLMKAALAVHNGVLPPTTGCRHPHEILRRHDAPLRLLSEPEPWPVGRRLASVSSMGFGGINTHVLLEGPSGGGVRRLPAAAKLWGKPLPEYEIVPVRAASRSELGERLAALARQAGALSQAELHDLAATSAGRLAGSWRATLVAARPEQLRAATESVLAALAGWDGGTLIDERAGWALGSTRPGRVGLLFPGQAAPVRRVLPGWAAELHVPAWPADVGTTSDSSVDTAVAQPAIVRQSLAGVAWLDALGCRPVGAVGHSLGELSALVWSGVLTAEDGLRLAVLRGRLMAQHGEPGTTMATLAAPADVVETLLAGTGVSISGHNAPGRTTIAGPADAVTAVLAGAAERNIPGAPLLVSHGFHSPAMRPVIEPLRAALAGIQFGQLGDDRPVVSTITGRPLTATADLAELLVSQLVAPVRFTDAVTELAARCDLLVEVGPGSTLTGPTAECAPDVPVVSLDCAGQSRRHAMATAALVAAADVDLTAWFADRAYRPLLIGDPIELLANPCETGPAAAFVPPPRQPAQNTPTRPAEAVHVGEHDLLEALRDHLAGMLELPKADIRPSSSLLDDLHLNSLQVVHSVTAVADALGRHAAEALPSLVNATVGDIADVLAALPEVDTPANDSAVTGVADWVRAFDHHWVRSAPIGDTDPVAWTVDAPDGHWAHRMLGACTTGVRGLAVVLADDGPDRVADLLRQAGTTTCRRFLLLHNGHPAAEGIARSVAVEVPKCAVTVLRLPADVTGFDLAHIAATGYRELRMTSTGVIECLRTNVHRPGRPTAIPLGTGDVCLVTGGAAGITAYSAAALAERTGARLVVLGRSAADSPTVVAAMRRLPESARYLRCDVTDTQSVRAVLATAAELGPVRGLLHGAGLNMPTRLPDVRAESLYATLAPKVIGLRNLLSVVGEQLRLVIGFGSIIGRRGLVGQAEYCVANDWMRHELESWAEEHPECRSHNIEWSLWAEIGMGSRLDVIDALHQQGVAAIRPDSGAQVLLELLTQDGVPTSVLIAGRFPAGDTLVVSGADVPALRFVEQVRAHTPGVEAVVDANLTPGADAALDDHRIDDLPVLPAVLGLEAMAQTATLLGGRRSAWSFEQVRLTAPVTLDHRLTRAIRLAALADAGSDAVDLVLRDDADQFTDTKFSARLTDADTTASPFQPPAPPEPNGIHPWYGPLMFHGGRFCRLIEYTELSAFRVSAWVGTDTHTRWFSEFYPSELLLGDPGVHDAAIHILMACVPHRRVLPVGIDRLTILREPAGPVFVRAREREHTADDYVFDVDVDTADGWPVARWLGLRLKAIAPHPWPGALPARLVGPLLTRRLIECGLAERIDLVSGTDGRIVTRADQSVGVDWRGVKEPERPWPELLGELAWQFATDTAAKSNEDITVAASRAQSALTALRELGRAMDQPSRIDQITLDGLIVAHCGAARVVTARVDSDLAPEPTVVAIATIEEE